MIAIKNFLRKVLTKACSSVPFNVIFGIIWFMNFVGGCGYLFFFNGGSSTSGLFGVLNIIVSLFLLIKSFAGMPDKDEK